MQACGLNSSVHACGLNSDNHLESQRMWEAGRADRDLMQSHRADLLYWARFFGQINVWGFLILGPDP